uniref:Interferon-induced GTP-binding protein Mx1 n=1 Tax=Sus scrofa TaxID=9823 RepID=A0A8D1UY61_PIG
MVYSSCESKEPDSVSASNHLLLNGNDELVEKSHKTGPENNLYSQYEEKVRPCIDLIDSLRALGVEQDLALPAIAVIGDQSSGKSSVLEALSGVALPRGSGIVTRCPLVLKLKKLVNEEDEWKGKVSYRDSEIELSDASQVEKEVSAAQIAIAGEGVGISHELISLEVSSPHVPDLTLIDLPGITRVAVGNQPYDIEYQIKSLIKKYICKQETINLVVVPCNVDIATTEALRMAQEVDPEGDRTIGEKREESKKLVGSLSVEKHPWNAEGVSWHTRRFASINPRFPVHPPPSPLATTSLFSKSMSFFSVERFIDLLEEGRATIPCLAERLTSELIMHICKTLPLLENQIKESHQKITEELQKYGSDIPEDESGKMFFLIDKIDAFNSDITALIQGEELVVEYECRLFTKMRNEFCKWSAVVEKNFKNGYDAICKQIQLFENQYRGRELPGFVNYKTFETIIKKQVSVLEEPAVDMLHTVTDLVRLAFTDVSETNFNEFFNLHRTAKSKIEDIKLEQEKEAETSIRLHFQMEQIVYCQDQVYRGALQKVREKEAEEEKNRKSNQYFLSSPAPSSDPSIAEIFQHLIAYHQEVGKRISSHIPLIIQFFILRTFGQQLQKSMLQLLQNKDQYDWLLRERSDTSDKRKFLKERLMRLTQARRRLAKFPG